ncbi:type II toxin-antitoxin system RelE/ParE family toxin [Arenibacter aquaticus]|uniref:Type II toxin-antitoxin system RelE/ParE family toxin n=1 Tax=Arenibacter aquaticus TaxID=2489054 RepID=A0A430K6M6_9FLAO|nr:type II toxin-antitoxin system RelE/ParE family toxin [Arenibacter aquaticus]RTE54726.1 type II toxin-antitoxin system RelE/ParE family toxin [Arenibacter aquaticus]
MIVALAPRSDQLTRLSKLQNIDDRTKPKENSMRRYALSYRADNDLDDITDYSLEIWGENQTRDYLSGLAQCFQALADKPDLGRSTAEYASPLKRY